MQEPLTIFNGFKTIQFQQNKNIQYHVGIVYRLLTEMIMFYALGMYLGGLLPFLSYLSFVGSFVSLFFIFSVKQEPNLYWSHMAISCSLGAYIGHIVRMLYIFDSSIVTSAISMVFITFLTFTYAAKFVDESHMVPIYGLLSSLLTGLVYIGLFKLFFGGSYNMFENGIALVTFSGFVTYDTFVMYNKFEKKDYNYYSHAFGLLLDLVNLFARLLEFFLNKSSNKKKRN
jgi:hypothetical protein